MIKQQKPFSSVFQLNQQTILVIGLMIASFFIGSLYTKNQYLEKNTSVPAQVAIPVFSNPIMSMKSSFKNQQD